MNPEQKITSDPVEKIVRDALDKAGVAYLCDSPLDFECDGFAIECKRFYSDRIIDQIKDRDNIIVIQGLAAAKAFANLLSSVNKPENKE